MNTTKRFALSALAVGLLLTLALLPGVWAQSGTQDAQAHMWQMRNIMHFALFTPQTTPTGVTVTVLSADPALAQAIQAEFLAEQAPQSPVEGSTVSAATAEGGVALTFASDDAAIVSQLQSYGSGLAYTLLRNDMHAVMWSGQGAAGSFGPGMMGPGMMGPGYGPGMMGAGRGFGPGMMGPGYGPQGSGPQGYGPQGSGPQGSGPGWMHGRGMMGGSGPGWGYGPQGPQGPAPDSSK